MPLASRPVSVLCSLFFLLSGLAAPGYTEALPQRAVTVEALKASLPPDVSLEVLAGGYVVAVPEPFAAPTVTIDPVYKGRYSRALTVYAPAGTTGSLQYRVVVHFEPEDRTSALKIARLTARLLRLHREHFDRETVFPRSAPVADVWLAPLKADDSVHLGGKTSDSNVYLFAVGAIKKPLELVRTVSHEWGHLTLPAARGFAEPENDAGGYLGERLYIKWLGEDRDASVQAKQPDDGTRSEDLALYRQRQIQPLIERWQALGPPSPVLDGDRTDAMDLYIGAALATDAAFHPRILGKALFTIEDVRARDFLRSLSTAITNELASAKGLYLNQAAWVWLPKGNYSLNGISGGGLVAVGNRINLWVAGPKGGSPPPGSVRKSTFAIAMPDWQWIRVTSGSLTEMWLRRIAPRGGNTAQ